jgi:hypothetical protein
MFHDISYDATHVCHLQQDLKLISMDIIRIIMLIKTPVSAPPITRDSGRAGALKIGTGTE